jgi:hypothetical protein
MRQAAQLNEEIAADLRSLERTVRQQSPGVMDLLQVYGGYEEAVQQAELYLGLAAQPVVISTSSSSNT